MKRRVGMLRDRHLLEMSHQVIPIDWFVFDASVDTLERAVARRVFLVGKGETKLGRPPRPAPLAFRGAALLRYRRLVMSICGMVCPMNPIEFVDSSPAHKRNIYDQARISLQTTPVAWEDAWLKTFVKVEKTNGTAKADPIARCIQPRSTRYGLSLGLYIRAIEHKLCAAINEAWGHPTIMKGFNADATGEIMAQKWAMYSDPVAIGMDASRFDQHCSVQALQYEHGFYLKAFSNAPELQRLLSWQLHNKGAGYCPDGRVKYQVEGCRMSGDMNTGLGNCVLMTSMVWALAAEAGIDLALANNGDDCTVFMERSDRDKFLRECAPYFLRCGYTMEVEDPVYTLEEVDFCQTHPVQLATGWRMIRDPRICMSKDMVTHKNIRGAVAYSGYLHDVATCGRILNTGVPVLYEFYKSTVRGVALGSVKNQEMTGMRHLAIGMVDKQAAVSEGARVSFYRAFGVEPSLQEQLEEHYRHTAGLQYQTPERTDSLLPHPSKFQSFNN